MEISSVNIKELVNCFHFQVMSIWWLHNFKYATYIRSDPLLYALQVYFWADYDTTHVHTLTKQAVHVTHAYRS